MPQQRFLMGWPNISSKYTNVNDACYTAPKVFHGVA